MKAAPPDTPASANFIWSSMTEPPSCATISVALIPIACVSPKSAATPPPMPAAPAALVIGAFAAITCAGPDARRHLALHHLPDGGLRVIGEASTANLRHQLARHQLAGLQRAEIGDERLVAFETGVELREQALEVLHPGARLVAPGRPPRNQRRLLAQCVDVLQRAVRAKELLLEVANLLVGAHVELLGLARAEELPHEAPEQLPADGAENGDRAPERAPQRLPERARQLPGPVPDLASKFPAMSPMTEPPITPETDPPPVTADMMVEGGRSNVPPAPNRPERRPPADGGACPRVADGRPNSPVWDIIDVPLSGA